MAGSGYRKYLLRRIAEDASTQGGHGNLRARIGGGTNRCPAGAGFARKSTVSASAAGSEAENPASIERSRGHVGRRNRQNYGTHPNQRQSPPIQGSQEAPNHVGWNRRT